MRKLLVFVVALLVVAFSGAGAQPEAYAQDRGAVISTEAPAQPAPPTLMQVLRRMMPMFIVVFFIFYFMVIKPQQAKMKTQQQLIGSLKKGDGVITTGGIHGKVVSVEENHILLDIAQNVRIKVDREHIARREQ